VQQVMHVSDLTPHEGTPAGEEDGDSPQQPVTDDDLEGVDL
jgi:hypothetical protein